MLPGLTVLRRRTGEVQFGLDPRHALVIGRLPDQLTRLTGRLRGDLTIAELLAGAGEHAPLLARLLARLTHSGLLEDATPRAVPAHLAIDGATSALAAGRPSAPLHPGLRAVAAVRVAGDGRLAVAIGCLLTAAGVGRVEVAATGRVRPEDVGTGYLPADVGKLRRSAARDALRRVTTEAITRIDLPRRPDLVVLTDAVVPAPEVVVPLFAERRSHLPVRVREGIGVVGPLVVPGRTSCLSCGDLHRCDRDPCWPALATQLAGTVVPADLATTQATAALASAQVLAALRWQHGGGSVPTTWNTSVELDVVDGSTRHRTWLPHLGCRCAALQPGPN